MVAFYVLTVIDNGKVEETHYCKTLDVVSKLVARVVDDLEWDDVETAVYDASTLKSKMAALVAASRHNRRVDIFDDEEDGRELFVEEAQLLE